MTMMVSFDGDENDENDLLRWRQQVVANDDDDDDDDDVSFLQQMTGDEFRYQKAWRRYIWCNIWGNWARIENRQITKW